MSGALPYHRGMTAEVVRDRRMTWDEYLALGEDVRGEYIDGCLHVTPRPTYEHQQAARRLTDLLETAGLLAVQEWAWKPGPHEYHPDVVVLPGRPDPSSPNRFLGVPELVVEVLPPSNVTDDTIRKRRDYARYGCPRYWILGPEQRTLWAFELRGGSYEQVAEITGTGTVPGAPEVAVDVDALLA